MRWRKRRLMALGLAWMLLAAMAAMAEAGHTAEVVYNAETGNVCWARRANG